MMHSFARHLHRSGGEATAITTKGLVLNQAWSCDLMEWALDAVVFQGQLRALRQRTIELADLRPGAQVLDVGCGTGTLVLDIQRRLGPTSRVVGIDPGPQRIARARAKAVRRHLPVIFQIGVIEQLAFPEETFDVVLATLMMHHLPQSLQRQGLAEIARVLKPGGRVVIADFTRKQERRGRAARFHAGGSALPDLEALVEAAGFQHLQTEEMQPLSRSAFPGAGFVRACKG